LLKNKIFALDIGTRSVVGIILEEQDGQFKVIDIHTKEHKERAMLDGQIHDVISVSKIIAEIKEDLEAAHGPLKKVCVAAAGRALKTKRAQAAVNITGKPIIQKDDILHLELSAVQQAQAEVAEEQKSDKSHYYYCVGYSVLHYRLDGEEIGNLIDQQGEEASVDIIATFLPRVVVESLISALHRAGLEMQALTLEPIAAINVLIPPSMRRLNVALVDIGAGTSDIALTDTGTVIAYGMVPVAGDEITESLSDQLLLDFPLAEEAKRRLLDHSTIQTTDILGFETEWASEDIISQIEPAIEKLADSICNEILQLNNYKSPKAVMLVGGGSLTPRLPQMVAARLELPENRVAIRGIDAVASLAFADHILKGPDLVTPVGIALAALQSPVQYRTVYVNDQPVRLFEVKKLTVGDCLLAAGIKMSKLYGKPGMAKIISLNDLSITIPGEHGNPPVLLQNGSACSLDDGVKDGDMLTVARGSDGRASFLKIKDLVDTIPDKHVKVNGKDYTVKAIISKNGVAASPEDSVEDRDKIECRSADSIESALKALNLGDLLKSIKPFHLSINGKETYIPSLSGRLTRNGIDAKPGSSCDDRDVIEVAGRNQTTVAELAEKKQLSLERTLPVFFNGERITLTRESIQIWRGDAKLDAESIIRSGDSILIRQLPEEPFIFQDLFNYVEVKPPAHAAGSFELIRNGRKCSFHEPVNAGDTLHIHWPEHIKVK
jgi:cell division protein FtsA